MTITQRTRKILWARSGNECAFDGCNQELIISVAEDPDVVLGEEAHIVAQKPDGPRGDGEPFGGDIDGVANLILLCPTHHRIIDEQQQAYGVGALLKIKRNHEDRVAQNRERVRPNSNFHPAVRYRVKSNLPIFQSCKYDGTIFVVSLLGDEPTSTGLHSWRGNGVAFEVIRSGEIVYSAQYSEADSDVLFSFDGKLVSITEQIFDFEASKDTPFIQKVIDLAQEKLIIRSIRLYTPPNKERYTEDEIMAKYNQWLADGVDPEIAVINLRDYGFENPSEVRSIIRKLFDMRLVDGAVAECASMVSDEVAAFDAAGNLIEI